MPSGVVIGATKVVNNGADGDHFVLVVAAEGFTAAQQADFESAVDDFLATLRATAPFSEPATWQRINVYRLDVHSTESGADNPLVCADDFPGWVHTPPTVAETRYQAKFCTSSMRRLLSLDELGQLLLDLDTHVSAWDAVVVAVNHQEYGGRGYPQSGVATYSMARDASQIAVHELGHVLDLADEYDTGSPDLYTGNEPLKPNVTTALSAAKWGSFVTATNLPTWNSPDCSISNRDALDPEPGAVGLYEGAFYHRCGVYRPQHNCYMRRHGVPFCVVCAAHIRDYLARPFHINTAGCFVATAVYGDPSHPDVRTLRRWRDRSLEGKPPGRHAMLMLDTAYRRIGPTAARLTRGRPWLTRILRRLVFIPAAGAIRRLERRRRTAD